MSPGSIWPLFDCLPSGRWSVPAALVVCAVFICTACGGSSDAAAPVGIASASAASSPTAVASNSAVAVQSRLPDSAVQVALQPAEVGDGETMLVRAMVRGAASGTLDFEGNAYPLTTDGELLWAVVGVPLEQAPGEQTLTVTARGGGGEVVASATARYAVVHLERPVDRVDLTDDEAAVVTPDGTARETALRSQQYAQFDRTRRWTGAFIRPTPGVITTEFGEGRSYNDGPVGSFHTGVDFGAQAGTSVLAPAAGRVSWVGPMPIRGNSVIVDHGAGVKTGYHHLQSIAVSAGDEVHTGTVLGAVGSTGLATGPHLHWELSVWGVNVDPLTWLSTSFAP